MKISKVVLVFSLLALAALSCESARSIFSNLSSTEDLRRVFEHKSIPAQSLLLLHLFANNVYIDHNQVCPLSLIQLQILAPMFPEGCTYYTLGNVNYGRYTCSNSRRVPEYVRRPLGLRDILMDNRARIIICVDYYECIRQVYLTQHYDSVFATSAYDPDCTFIITPNLLSELQQFSFNDDVAALKRLRNHDDTDQGESTERYKHNQWQWVVHFQKGPDSGDDETLEYCTGTKVKQDLQARFMIKDYEEKARTPEWPINSSTTREIHLSQTTLLVLVLALALQS
ncbi:hypothetical protein WMY93_018384 [Mugilogobius chulae]|uniref:Secreted protein n=1 Tax=Mugilogobius chulae TaxID=88201 RepID=A0AAW0NNQ2_9GOBI